MKSHATFVMTLYSGIFQDAAIWWPDIRSTMEKDLSYLHSAFEHRGLSFFTLTLPDYGHWLDMSFDRGAFLDFEEIPRGIPKSRTGPGLFRGILMKVFDTDGMLRSNADAHAVLILRTLCQSCKKLQIDVKPSLTRKTVEEFFDVEERLPRSHPDTWDCEIPVWKARTGHPLWGDSIYEVQHQADLFGAGHERAHHPPWESLRQLCRRLTSAIGVPDWWSLRPRHGPGATAEDLGGERTKYAFPYWSRRLESWFPYDWHGSGSLDGSRDEPNRGELSSKLRAVPKTPKGPRLICKEPISNQWMQQGISAWLEERIRSTAVGRSFDVRDQTVSQRWALEASANGANATLDLKAASDRLSTRLVEYVFQGSEILDGFHAVRTRSLEQTLHRGLPKLTMLRKFSTAGSALTFPVQSIVFSVLSVWALRLYEGREWDFRNWEADFDRVRVYGDDIITPVEAYGVTKFVLHECGLLVNTRKSFGGNHFRESCGMDAFQGVDVTPPRYKQPYSGTASSTAALVEYSNNLFMKGMWHASHEVLRALPIQERKLLWVGRTDESRLGLLTFCKGRDPSLERSKVWDPDLQRSYYRRLAFTARPKRYVGRGEESLVQFFTERPAEHRFRRGKDPLHTAPLSGSPEMEILAQGRSGFVPELLDSRECYLGTGLPYGFGPEPIIWHSGSQTLKPRLAKRRVRVYC